MSDEMLTLKEIADYLKLAEKTAYRLAAEDIFNAVVAVQVVFGVLRKN